MVMEAEADQLQAVSRPQRETFERIVPLEHIAVRSDGTGRTVEAYAAVFNRTIEVDGYYFVDPKPTRDGYGPHEETIEAAAFEKTINDNGVRFQVLFNHGKTIQGVPAERYSMPLGTPLELRTDRKGLLTVTRYAKTPLSDEVLELIANGSIRSQSFGGRIVKASVVTRRAKDSLDLVSVAEIGLKEYGPCVFPAYPDAEIVAVRADFLAEELEGLSDEERHELLERLRVTLSEAAPSTSEPAPTEVFQSELARYAKERPQELARMIQGAIEVTAPEPPAPEAETTEPAEVEPEEDKEAMVNPNVSLTELEARQQEIKTELERIDADAGMAMRSDSQREEWDKLIAERDENAAVIADKERRLAQLGETERSQNGSNHAEQGYRAPEFQTVRRPDDIYDLSTVRGVLDNPAYARQELRDRAMAAIERAHYPSVGRRANKEDMQTQASELLDHADTEDGLLARRMLVTGHPLYEGAFWKSLQGRHLSTAEDAVMERAALLTSTAGYAVPFALDPTVVLISNGVANPIRRISRVVQIAGDTWKGVNSAGITASYDLEQAAVSEDTPTLTQPTVTTLTARAFVPYSIEAESWTGLREEMTTEFADSKDVLEATQFTLGTGTPQPQGIIPFSTNLATTAGTASLALSDIDNLTDSLPERFQSNASILASRKIFSKVRQLGRTAGASDEWAPQQQGFPPSLNGYPKEILSTIVSTTTSNSLIMVVGDFRRFLIVDKIGMSVEYIPHLFDPSSPGYPTGTRGLFAYWRNNSLVQVVNAFRVLKVL